MIFRKIKILCLEKELDDIFVSDIEEYIIKTLIKLEPKHNNSHYRFVNNFGDIVLAIHKSTSITLINMNLVRDIYEKNMKNQKKYKSVNTISRVTDDIILETLNKYLFLNQKIPRIKPLTHNAIWYVTERNAPL